jgi:hypothetical protein
MNVKLFACYVSLATALATAQAPLQTPPKGGAWTPPIWGAGSETVFLYAHNNAIDLVRFRLAQGGNIVQDPPLYSLKLSSTTCGQPTFTPLQLWSNPVPIDGQTFEVVFGVLCDDRAFVVRAWNRIHSPEMVSELGAISLRPVKAGQSRASWAQMPFWINDRTPEGFFDVLWRANVSTQLHYIRMSNSPGSQMIRDVTSQLRVPFGEGSAHVAFMFGPSGGDTEVAKGVLKTLIGCILVPTLYSPVGVFTKTILSPSATSPMADHVPATAPPPISHSDPRDRNDKVKGGYTGPDKPSDKASHTV